MKKNRVFIVDDHPVVREGISRFINNEPDFYVCGESDNVNDAIAGISKDVPDIVVVDITLKGGSGIELTNSVKKRFNIPVLVLSMHDESIYAERALKAGAKGYIMKRESMENVITAMREILDGSIYLNPKIKDKILSKLLGNAEDMSDNPLDCLTNQELQVFRKIGTGLTTKLIAVEMGLKAKTVETYRERIKKKLNLKNSSELIQYAVQWESIINNP